MRSADISWLRSRLNFSIFRLNFPINFKIFTEFFQNFAIFSEFLNEFEYFGARSWNSDKNLSKFRWEISFLMNFLWCFDWIFNIQFRKIVDDFSLKFSDWRGAKVCKSCRSRKMLQNDYLVAKIGFDTEENELLQIWGVIQFNIQSTP